MWVIGVYAAMMLFVIVQSVRRGLPTLYFAREPSWELGAPSGLPEAEDRRVTAFVEQLRAAGFVLERESKLVAPALRDRPPPPTLWTAVYSHPDATSYVQLSISRSDLPGGNAVWSSTLVFASRLARQRRLSTSTSPTRFAMPAPPGWDARRVVDATATALWALHQARLQAAGGAERVDDPWSDYLERERQAQLYAIGRAPPRRWRGRTLRWPAGRRCWLSPQSRTRWRTGSTRVWDPCRRASPRSPDRAPGRSSRRGRVARCGARLRRRFTDALLAVVPVAVWSRGVALASLVVHTVAARSTHTSRAVARADCSAPSERVGAGRRRGRLITPPVDRDFAFPHP